MNEIDHYSHLLTGYIGSKSFLEKVKSVVEHLKTVNPQLTYGAFVNMFKSYVPDIAFDTSVLLYLFGCMYIDNYSLESSCGHIFLFFIYDN